MTPSETADLARQRDKVQAETQAVTERRATIERLRETQPSGGLKLDARRIRLFAGSVCGEAVGPFAHLEVERLFDEEVRVFRERLEALAGELTT